MATRAAPATMPVDRAPTDWESMAMQRRIARRYAAERNFRLMGLAALALAAGFLAFLLFTIVRDGWTGFQSTQVRVEVVYDSAVLGLDPAQIGVGADPAARRAAFREADFPGLMLMASGQLGAFDSVVSEGAWLALRDRLEGEPGLLGQREQVWVPVRSTIDLLNKGKFDLEAPAISRGVSDRDIRAWRTLESQGKLRTGFNTIFLATADSTVPELAGIWGAALGSLFTLLVTIAVSFPIGVGAAIWLEEFAPKNRWTDIVEVSINNLAAVPSIIFGLLGLAVFLNVFGMPRSAPLVGGLTLALMTLPVIVISARVSIKAVPPSIRDAALGIGASPIQVVFQHVLPLALPGILTGTIIGIARALGETAPLLLIGMRAFVVDTPQGLTQPATVLPVQVFLWSDDVARGFIEKTSAAIMVLMMILIAMNSAAIYLRNKFERRW